MIETKQTEREPHVVTFLRGDGEPQTGWLVTRETRESAESYAASVLSGHVVCNRGASTCVVAARIEPAR